MKDARPPTYARFQPITKKFYIKSNIFHVAPANRPADVNELGVQKLLLPFPVVHGPCRAETLPAPPTPLSVLSSPASLCQVRHRSTLRWDSGGPTCCDLSALRDPSYLLSSPPPPSPLPAKSLLGGKQWNLQVFNQQSRGREGLFSVLKVLSGARYGVGPLPVLILHVVEGPRAELLSPSRAHSLGRKSFPCLLSAHTASPHPLPQEPARVRVASLL